MAPVTCTLGVLSCLFLLMFGENWYNWTLMGLWTVVGFAIYFGYGYRHSKLRNGLIAPDIGAVSIATS